MDSSRVHTETAEEVFKSAPSPYKKIYRKYFEKNYELQRLEASTFGASSRNQSIKEEIEEVYMIDDDFATYHPETRTRLFF